jgi:hypothetical protein
MVLYFMAMSMTLKSHSSKGSEGCSKVNKQVDFVDLIVVNSHLVAY